MSEKLLAVATELDALQRAYGSQRWDAEGMPGNSQFRPWLQRIVAAARAAIAAHGARTPGPATADVLRIFSLALGYVDRMATERPGYRMHLDDFELSVKITTGQARAFLAEHEAATTGNVMPIEDPGDPAFYS